MKFSEWQNQLCNRENGEHIWRTHMLNSERVSREEFESHCDVGYLLDEDESFDDYCNYNENTDFFRTTLKQSPCYILKLDGVAVFFTPDGRKLEHFDIPGNWLMEEQLYDAGLAKVVAPANSAAADNNGLEVDHGMITNQLQHIEGKYSRFLWHVDNQIVAGLSVNGIEIDKLYVCLSTRRNGYASALFKAVKKLIPELKHSKTLTHNGQDFVAGLSKGLEQ